MGMPLWRLKKKSAAGSIPNVSHPRFLCEKDRKRPEPDVPISTLNVFC